ncbi:hypothetical protein [Staphylococcus xylosus]
MNNWHFQSEAKDIINAKSKGWKTTAKGIHGGQILLEKTTLIKGKTHYIV